MKQILIALVICLLATAPTVFADPKIDFNAKCAVCHRTNANLMKQARLLKVHPGKLALQTSKMTREEMIAITEKGKDKMPGFEKDLTRKQIEDIIEYVLALSNRKGTH